MSFLAETLRWLFVAAVCALVSGSPAAQWGNRPVGFELASPEFDRVACKPDETDRHVARVEYEIRVKLRNASGRTARLPCLTLKADTPLSNPPPLPGLESSLIHEVLPTDCADRFIDLLPGEDKELTLRQEYKVFLGRGRRPPTGVLAPGNYTMTAHVQWGQWGKLIVRPEPLEVIDAFTMYSLQEVFAFEIPRYVNVEACVAGKRPRKIASLGRKRDGVESRD